MQDLQDTGLTASGQPASHPAGRIEDQVVAVPATEPLSGDVRSSAAPGNNILAAASVTDDRLLPTAPMRPNSDESLQPLASGVFHCYYLSVACIHSVCASLCPTDCHTWGASIHSSTSDVVSDWVRRVICMTGTRMFDQSHHCRVRCKHSDTRRIR